MQSRVLSPLVAAVLSAALVTLLAAGAALAVETTFTTDLTGATEVPPGDPDGSGSATVVIDPEAGTVCWEISTEGIMQPVTASHIHEGAVGVAGPVFVNLDVDGFEETSEGCNEGLATADLQAIVDNPAGYYVNVHNEEFPGGAVRGQLAAEAPDTAISGSPSAPLTVLGLVALAAGLGLALRVSPRRVTR